MKILIESVKEYASKLANGELAGITESNNQIGVSWTIGKTPVASLLIDLQTKQVTTKTTSADLDPKWLARFNALIIEVMNFADQIKSFL